MPTRQLMGHVWTVGRDAGRRLAPQLRPKPFNWKAPISTAVQRGALATPDRFIAGTLDAVPGSKRLVIVVHGLGGNGDAPYCQRMAQAANAAGYSALRLHLRGTHDQSCDFYHAGLVSDLEDALACPSLAAYDSIDVIGFSLGGHLGLRLGLKPPANLRSVVGVCAPLCLERSSVAIDRPQAWLYRHHVLLALKQMARRLLRTGWEGPSWQRVRSIKTLRQWDEVVVAPRHGFTDAQDYYRSVSVGPHLDRLAIPALWFGSWYDPMIPANTVLGSLRASRGKLRWALSRSGGHIGFPKVEWAGCRVSLETLVLDWLRASPS